MSISAIDREPKHLHPAFRQKAQELLQKLAGEGIPFRLFEGFRTPSRQQYLYDQGRTRPGPIVTKARPWQSYHQYGVSGDFVLYENGQWSWNDKGPKAAWWDRLHQLGQQVGLEPLSWEKPHLQLKGLSTGTLQAGQYPHGGDETWAEHLADAIYGWTGSPPAPPAPATLSDRPGLSEPAPALDLQDLPAMGSSDWHNQFDGRVWRYDNTGIYLKEGGGVVGPLRTPGEPLTCRKILSLCGDEIAAAAKKHQVPPALIIMTIATETAAYRKVGFTGPSTFRWEPHVKVTDVSPPLLGDYSAGPMQTLATTARWVIRAQNLDYDPFKVAPVYEFQPEPPADHPLYGYRVNIDIGAAEIKQRWGMTGDDPILVGAAYNAGGLYKSTSNPWRLRSSGNHLQRAAEWYGDACAVLKEV
ncbi:MAG: hypothetical protein FJ128_05810 [Deltaproteobacteria bacterium]|nr:hypothetical protein [Deltaproteobacteria bacterium]